MRATWNLWLVNKDESPLLYMSGLNEAEAIRFARIAAEKAFDGSDADGYLLIRSDYGFDITIFKPDWGKLWSTGCYSRNVLRCECGESISLSRSKSSM